MRYVFPFVFLFVVSLTSCKEATVTVPEDITTTTYYLIRHAEKDRTDSENRDPSLTEEGLARATNWATIFKDVPFDKVYSTDYTRTKETATPTATQKGLELQTYDPSTLFDANFEKETKGKTVLVVGHSNTTPMFANAILNEERFQHIDDSNNSNLYIITLIGEEKSVQLLHIN
ncbi:phosphoglycerate mutase family protein [uncultured Dokdonia sp.]|uniref:SixA phosphatase family protein n=1 Tax=uncultured Dokdonia sp. TaxID=575653 RepID=UPI00262E217B|nr:phosphoglycerate mutase family protein [uncultured Dokdonia sp.]